MAGLLFDYTEGYVRVAFAPDMGGYFRIDIQLHGDGVITTPCDDQWVKGEGVLELAPDLRVTAYTSDCTARFFSDMLSWLEAVTCGVYECAFIWEAEGPEGSLRWFRHHDGRGRLCLTWDGLRDQPAVECSVLLNKLQMVQAFYQAYLDLVASPDYCPLVHEPITIGACIAYVLDESDAVLLPKTLVDSNRSDAYALVDTILNFGYNQGLGAPQRASLASFLEQAEKTSAKGIVGSNPDDALIDHSWDDWSRDQRIRFIDEMYGWNAWYSSGERLSTLRSPGVEAWLAKAIEPGSVKTP